MYGTCTVFVRYMDAQKAYKYRTNTVQIPYKGRSIPLETHDNQMVANVKIGYFLLI